MTNPGGVRRSFDATGLAAGLTVRSPEPDDADAVLDLVTRCDLAVLGSSDATRAQVVADLAAPGYDRVRGGLVVVDPSTAIVGYLWTEDDTESDAVFIDPYSLDPEMTAWLARRGIEYVHALAAERGHPLTVDAGSFEPDRSLVAALAAIGLEVRRRFWRMRVDLDGNAWPVPEPAAGVVVRQPDPAVEDTYRLLYHLIGTSMAEHWDHPDHSYPAWRERFDASAGQDPRQWWVAESSGTPVAVLVGDDSRAELGIAWVRTLGVLPGYRGRGLGKLLLRTAFAAAAARGMLAVGLAVDSENPTGATALYESVGMRVETVLLAWKGEAHP